MSASLHILMVEDTLAHAELAEHALRTSGFTFTAVRVETKAEFEHQLAVRPPDLILSDYTLPTFDGLAALHITQALAPDIPFIFVTGTMGEEAAIETLKIGATDYVLKSRLSRLGLSVQRALRESSERRERRLAEVELRHSNEQLRALSGHLQHVREEERTRISRQVHDGLGQALTGLKLDLSWLAGHLPAGAGNWRRKARALSASIDATIQLVRQISTDLRPGVLDTLGLVAAIEWQAQEFQQRTGIVCHVTTDVADTLWEQEFSTAFFRIFQEILTNVIHHAGATRVETVLRADDRGLTLTVRDNGCGITAAQAASARSIGLIGMRERANLLGGELAVGGRPADGTTVTARIPFPTTAGVAGPHPHENPDRR